MCITCESLSIALRELLNDKEFSLEDRKQVVEFILNRIKWCNDKKPAPVIYPGYFIKN
jgi:hypothetical protein